MGLMTVPQGGDFLTYLKFDARSGIWSTKPEGGGDVFEIPNMTAIFDLENVKTGWIEFTEGAGPTKVWDKSLTEAAPKPAATTKNGPKRGFEIIAFSDKNIGGLREFCSTAGAVIESINTLYDEWEAAPERGAGKLPVVQCTGTVPKSSGKSTNRQPILKIVAWADRPPEMVAAAPPAQAKAPPAHTPPPAAAAPVAAGAEPDF